MTNQELHLKNIHIEHKAIFVNFAGYQMPQRYDQGIIYEHNFTRTKAGIFDVSHMQAILLKSNNTELERILPIDLDTFKIDSQTYSFILNQQGGFIDDCVIARLEENIFILVCNASRKQEVISHLENNLKETEITSLNDHCIIAIQGPFARTICSSVFKEYNIQNLEFQKIKKLNSNNNIICCSGYTGEDGFEVIIHKNDIEKYIKELIKNPNTTLCGLGARDTLRLEAGLPLYGNDLNEQLTPYDAGLLFAIKPSRRIDGAKAGGFIGAEALFNYKNTGIKLKRIGLIGKDKREIVRSNTPIFKDEALTQEIGKVTSGSLSITLDKPIAMAYINTDCNQEQYYTNKGSSVITLTTHKMPFITPKYFRLKK